MSLEKHLPLIKNLFTEKILSGITTTGVDIIKDDKKLKPLLAKVHGFLPLPVRLVVGEDSFVKFCLTHKKSLFPAQSKPVKKVVAKKAAPKKIAAKKTAKKK